MKVDFACCGCDGKEALIVATGNGIADGITITVSVLRAHTVLQVNDLGACIDGFQHLNGCISNGWVVVVDVGDVDGNGGVIGSGPIRCLCGQRVCGGRFVVKCFACRDLDLTRCGIDGEETCTGSTCSPRC